MECIRKRRLEVKQNRGMRWIDFNRGQRKRRTGEKETALRDRIIITMIILLNYNIYYQAGYRINIHAKSVRE